MLFYQGFTERGYIHPVRSYVGIIFIPSGLTWALYGKYTNIPLEIITDIITGLFLTVGAFFCDTRSLSFSLFLFFFFFLWSSENRIS